MKAIDAKQASALANILKNVCGLRDAENKAEALLDQFGSFKGVIEARPEAVAKYTTEATARKIAAILPAVRAYIASLEEEPTQITNASALANYCKSLLCGERVEKFYVICVNAQCRMVGARCISTGSLSEVAAYPRLVAETALNYNAHSVFFCHNHPGGTCAPSQEDIRSTLQLQRLLSQMGITVLDHMIVANDKTYSMIQNGDFSAIVRG